MQACKVTFSNSGKKCMLSAGCFEDLLRLAAEKLKKPVRMLELETADGFEISSDQDFQVFLNQTADRCFVVSFKEGVEEDVLHECNRTVSDVGEEPILLNRTETVGLTTAAVEINGHQKNSPFADLRQIIRNCGRPTAIVDGLIESLDSNSEMQLKDQRLLNKVLATHLYVNFGKKQNPDPIIIDDLAQAIITQFLVTKSAVGSGREPWFDIETGKGRLIKYVGRKRRNAGVKRSYKKKSPVPIANLEITSVAERFMKNCMYTSSNAAQMREAHENTFSVRRAWITDKGPTVKEILERFPRFIDMVEAIETDFHRITGCVVATFVNKWLAIENKIIALLSSSIRDNICQNGSLAMKSQAAFKLLVQLLPGTPGKKTRGRKPAVDNLEKQLFQTFPANFNPNQALAESQTNGMLQPGVLIVGDSNYFFEVGDRNNQNQSWMYGRSRRILVAFYYVFNYKGTVKNNATISTFITKLKTIPNSGSLILDEVP